MTWSIKVENLSKLYRIGSDTAKTETLYAKIFSSVKQLWSKQSKEDLIRAETLARSENHIISQAQTDDVPDGHFWALKNVSFEVNQGDRIGILGQNGSGKSTLLKILSRITSPTKGQFRYRGRLVSLLEVGTGFHVELSGRDNIYLNAAINGMSPNAIRAKFDEIVEFSELGEHIYTPVKRYSSGMYMRLAFSVAAHLESEILVVDEVLAVGDSGFQKKCKEKMLEVAGQGRTLLFVSHDMAAVQSICNKAIELSHGQLVHRHHKLSDHNEPHPTEIIILNNETDPAAEIQNTQQLHATEANKETESCSDDDPVMDVTLATAGYMQAKFIPKAERTWSLEKAPGFADCVKLLAITVLNRNNELCTHFDVNDDVIIEIKFSVKHAMFPLLTRISVNSLTGSKVFVTQDNLDWSNSLEIRQPGIYTQRCIIPAPFFNEGAFLADVYIATTPTANYFLTIPDAVSWQVNDNMKEDGGVRGNFSGPWEACILRPRLPWQINYEPV